MSHYSMNKKDLKKLSKSELIKLLLKQEKKNTKFIFMDDSKPVAAPRIKKPAVTPRKSVKELVDYFESQRLPAPPSEWLQEIEQLNRPVPLPRAKKPVPAPRTKIEQTEKALKGFTKSYEINIKNDKDPLVQLQNTRKAVANHIENILISMKGLKFVETLKVTFTKMSNGEIVYKTAYFNSPVQTIINDTQIDESVKVSKQDILNKIAVWISEGSGWTVESVENHHLNIVKYEPIKGSSYIKLPHELRNSSQSLINIKNSDNECFRWCHIRHLNPQDKNPQRTKKIR